MIHLPVALVAPKTDDKTIQTNTCPDCGHATPAGRWSTLAALARLRHGGVCREELQVIFDEDGVRCGCRSSAHAHR